MARSPQEAPFFIKPLSPVRSPRPDISPKGTAVLQRMNQDIQYLNRLITDYNQADSRSNRIAKLKYLDKERQRLDDEYGDIEVSAFPDYQTNVYKFLQQAMAAQRAQLHIDSSYQGRAIYVGESGRELSDILDIMSTEEVTQIMQVLATAKGKNIRKQLEQIAPSNIAYQTFLITHDVEFIGGGNSKNFAFVNRTNAQRIILKLENRLDTPKKEERELRMALSGQTDESNFLVREWSDRRVVYRDTVTQAITARRLTVMDCSRGRVLNDLPVEADMAAQQSLAVDVALAQIMVYNKMHLLGKTWSDGKGENIFFYRDPRTQVLKAEIADCKAIYSCDPVQRLAPDENYLGTPGASAPEFTGGTAAVDVDKAGVYAIGKNLYESLIRFIPDACRKYFTPNAQGTRPYERDELPKSYFKHAIFAEPFQSLIQSIVKTDPSARLSMDELFVQLLEIKYAQHPNYAQYQQVFQKIREVLAFDLEQDEKQPRAEFIYKCQQTLLNPEPDLDKLNQRLSRVIQKYVEKPTTVIYKEALDTQKKSSRPENKRDKGLET